MANYIGVSRKQEVFAVKETSKGVLTFPASGDFVLPVGNCVMNQKPAYKDSEEIKNSLDVINQFQSTMPAGTYTLNTYLRPAGTVGSVPQGDVLFQSLQGTKNAATSATSVAAIATTATTMTFKSMSGGVLPEKGVILVDDEKIYYGTKSQVAGASTGTLSNLTRGFQNTTAVEHDIDDDIDLQSVFYKQATTSPAFSLWVKTDHFTQFMSGCSVAQASFGVTNEGAVTVNFSGSGMKMGYAGTDDVVGNAATSATQISVVNARKFTINARIRNATKNDNATSGYTITAVNIISNIITVSPALVTNWESDDIIEGYLPTGTEIGTPIESRFVNIWIDGVAGKFKSSEISIAAPKKYIEDEVGTKNPEDFIEDARAITSNMNIYFRKDDADFFTVGSEGNEVPILISYASEDSETRSVELYLKRCKIEVPEISADVPTISLSMPWKALGTLGEDSLEIVFNE